MRSRRQPAPNPDHELAVAVARNFQPSELDLDGLAEAIRSLLGPGQTGQIEPYFQQRSDLLSSRNRVTHVVEANEAL